MKLFVNNLAWKTTDEDLLNHFQQAGQVIDANVVVDRQTGRSRGFGFVSMPDQAAQVALRTLNQTSLGGRTISVAEAKEKPRNR